MFLSFDTDTIDSHLAGRCSLSASQFDDFGLSLSLFFFFELSYLAYLLAPTLLWLTRRGKRKGSREVGT